MRVSLRGLIVVLLSFCESCDGLMFQSKAVTSQWDTWAFVENGTYYAYYLITEHSPGEGFGVATSTDGVHFKDHGYVFHGPSWVEHKWWEGTGSVWRAPDFNSTGRYLINYSQDPGGGIQNISFAESYDLIHWTKTADLNATYFDIDTRYYKSPGRWDCIYTIPVPGNGEESARDGYPRYGFWTASPNNGGFMGFGLTHDGIHWEALPSPQMIPPVGGEVGAVELISYGNATYKNASFYAILGIGGGMTTYVAQAAAGPYHIASKNFRVLPSAHSCYFARFFRGVNEELLVTHQSFSHVGRTYIAPYKKADVDAEGTLRLKWWPANDALHGASILVKHNETEGAQHLLQTLVDPAQGAIFEASIKLPADLGDTELPLDLLPGLIVETKTGGAVIVVVDSSA